MSRELLVDRIRLLGDPLDVDMTRLTHNTIQADRSVITKSYGGKPKHIFPKITRNKLGSHGFDDWMTPDPELHPFLPPSPGFPGLVLFADGDDEIDRHMKKRFRVVIQRDPTHFEYVGQYALEDLGEVSPEEWKSQPKAVFIRLFFLHLFHPRV